MKKLSFKGDAKVAKKTKTKKRVTEAIVEDEPTPEGWVMALKAQDITGPCLMITSTTEVPSILNCIQGTEFTSFKPPPHEDMPLNPTLETIEPWIASQVLVCHNLPSAKSITFKNAFDKYLTADKFGVVSCTMEAAGPAEAWDVVETENGFAFQTLWYTYFNSGT